MQSGVAGFTLVEVLVALMIVATTIATLQTVSNATFRSAIETNRMRIAKMLLRQKVEEVAAGLEQGTGGAFDGYANYTWELAVTEIPVIDQSQAAQANGTNGTAPAVGSTNSSIFSSSTGGGASGAAATGQASQESVLSVTVTVHLPSFGAGTTDASSLSSAEDGPGTLSVTTLLDPPNAQLQPPTSAQGTAGRTTPGGS